MLADFAVPFVTLVNFVHNNKATTRPTTILQLTYSLFTESRLPFVVIKTSFIPEMPVTVFTSYSNLCK